MNRLSQDALFEIARRAARKFVRRVGGGVEYEDAFQDACLVVASASYDPTRSPEEIRSYLTTKAFWTLLRKRQNETGARLKRRPKFEPLVADPAERPSEEEPDLWADVRIGDAIARHAARIAPLLFPPQPPAPTPFAEAFDDELRKLGYRDAALVCNVLLNGARQTGEAKRLGLSKGRVSQIVGTFVEALKARAGVSDGTKER